jgi:hypothetical protein
VVEVQGLERMMGADAVAGGFRTELRAFRRFIGGIAAGLVSLRDEGVVVLAWDNEEF